MILVLKLSEVHWFIICLVRLCDDIEVSRRIMQVLMIIRAWVAGNEVVVKNVNANIPVSLSWLLRTFLAFLCFPGSAQFIASSS